MKTEKEYFGLTLEELQSLGKWAADCAERSLFIYESIEKNDNRPRQAINAIREFAANGKRTNTLRKIAFDAHRAASETKNMAASAAAKAASLAAASAYTHPYKDIHQAKHILGPAAYSALAIELLENGDVTIGEQEIEQAADQANHAIAGLLNKMPAYTNTINRINQLFYSLDQRIREKFRQPDSN